MNESRIPPRTARLGQGDRFTIPEADGFRPASALVFYHSKHHGHVATYHKVRKDLQLGPPRAIHPASLVRQIQKQSGGRERRAPFMFLPPHVLAITERGLLWFTPPQRRPIYVGKEEINVFLPGLIWRVEEGSLALAVYVGLTDPPTAESFLYHLDYDFISPDGSVHLCGVKKPRWTRDLSRNIEAWQDAFFDSRWGDPSPKFLALLEERRAVEGEWEMWPSLRPRKDRNGGSVTLGEWIGGAP